MSDDVLVPAKPVQTAALCELVTPQFVPTARDWAMFDAWCRLRSEKKPTTQANIAHLMGITQQAVSLRWRRDGFGAWWNEEMRRLQVRAWEMAKAAQAMKAADDLEVFKALIPIFEPQAVAALGVGGAKAGALAANSFEVHIHK